MKKILIVILLVIITSCASNHYIPGHGVYKKNLNVGDKFIYSEVEMKHYTLVQRDTVIILGFNYNCVNVQRGKTKFWIDGRYFRHLIEEVQEEEECK